MKFGSLLLLAALLVFASSIALENEPLVTCQCESLHDCTCCENTDINSTDEAVCVKTLFCRDNGEVGVGNKLSVIIDHDDLPEKCYQILYMEVCLKFTKLEVTKEKVTGCILLEFNLWFGHKTHTREWCF